MIETDLSFRRHPRWLLPTMLAVVAIILTAVGVSINQVNRPQHMATFTSTGATLGDWTMDVDVCHTGSRKNFIGAQFYSSADNRLGVWMIEDPFRGLVPSVNSTITMDSINVAPANCSVLKGHAQNTSTTSRPPAMIAGEYTLDCTVDQSHLTGHVVFKDCL